MQWISLAGVTMCMCLLPLYFHRQTPLHQLIHDHDRYCPEESPPKLTNRALVAFQWTFEGHGCSETFMQKMACKDAARRPVPFPKSWKTAIKVVTTIDRMRRDAIVEASRLIENPQCDCRLLGVPKPQEVLDELCGTPVAVVFLTCARAKRQGFLLCARGALSSGDTGRRRDLLRQSLRCQ